LPSVSEAQRRYLHARFGHAWVKRHHFDNPGPLPKKSGHPDPRDLARAMVKRR
jgi:hypothetical protein